MMGNDQIKEKLWNINLVIDDIKCMPQTYDTILKDLKCSGTCQTILRRKLSRLCKFGDVFKMSIPGTRFGQSLFYCIPKNYFILVESTRLGSKVFCFSEFERKGRYYLKVKKCFELKSSEWLDIGEKVFFEGDVLKFL